ncbi:taurine catabolism dioxygenase TauD, TfdA family protein [Eremomyces bilateralis CBS 781.70]|uniref:Taurine catabolism dioxygenase TauD, TfdA family protein n=1 Tax=Eremomyces bilateralis CBS 781.70 TaxID=1392243 RepID=A0A6G1FY29_9PEZI|nr:taurine catabolism dioxygenase TauD, TfdA family protein [Eremomyces bilateralis CBS 781.70]KAF1810703.1 taurine catabolism dioxygenase TauD, TfdA family protein [Eremomyces bilateralis CBS 781.70]
MASRSNPSPPPEDTELTSGQSPPIYSLLRPYAAFPKKITGPTVWTKEEYEQNPTRWTHAFTSQEIKELGDATDQWITSGKPLVKITKEYFPFPTLAGVLANIRQILLDGPGFVLFKGIPVETWGTPKSAVAYMALGSHLGHAVSQNGKGHILGHVKDLNEDATRTDKVRIYRTNARQFFHTDAGDMVGLLCLARALEGGESDVVSTHNLFNVLQEENPRVAELLTQPIWYFDQKGETSDGQKEWIRGTMLYIEPKEGGRVFGSFDPYYVTSLKRFSDAGLVPPLSDEQKNALEVLESTCLRLALHMILEVGDIQFLSNAQVLHARTAYKDAAPPAPRRHLLRLWLSTPEYEGGWKIPFEDSNRRLRSGIQVNRTPPVANLEAD